MRTILPGKSRFDHYVDAVIKGDRKEMERTLSADEVTGLRLFIGKARCINCHNGPLFSDGDFQIIHVPDPAGLPVDRGRADAIPLLSVAASMPDLPSEASWFARSFCVRQP